MPVGPVGPPAHLNHMRDMLEVSTAVTSATADTANGGSHSSSFDGPPTRALAPSPVATHARVLASQRYATPSLSGGRACSQPRGGPWETIKRTPGRAGRRPLIRGGGEKEPRGSPEGRGCVRAAAPRVFASRPFPAPRQTRRRPRRRSTSRGSHRLQFRPWRGKRDRAGSAAAARAEMPLAPRLRG